MPCAWPWPCASSPPPSALVNSCRLTEPSALASSFANRLSACEVLPLCPKAASNSDWLIPPSLLLSRSENICWLSASPLTISIGCSAPSDPCACIENSALRVDDESGLAGAPPAEADACAPAEAPAAAAGSNGLGGSADELPPPRACCNEETRSRALEAAAPARKNMTLLHWNLELAVLFVCKGRAGRRPPLSP